ncbi:MAG: 2,4-dihydroxyhept-2-ene-1,7-dioic acid aldolase [Fibrobacteria bacterium]|nr:2,4-dihydroxyhept-2-ene-1,7-dioic acid aldolase [Fibrobacteria bacterium]
MNSDAQRSPNRLKRDLAAGKVCLGSTITMNSSTVAEILSHVGLDWIWLEMEHSSLGENEVLGMLQATNGSSTSTVVRVAWNDKTLIKRALDLGPDGIIVPLVNSRQEAEEAVRAMKYPPLGERGAGLGRAQAYGLAMGEYLGNANDEVVLIPMIEHVRAVENIEEILAVPGVDSIMVGALDLSGSMNKLGNTADPEVEGAVQKVLAACKKAGKPAGIIAVSPEQANLRIQQGFTNIIIGIDVLYLHGAVRETMGKIVRP